jgi:histone deacetylase 1/2
MEDRKRRISYFYDSESKKREGEKSQRGEKPIAVNIFVLTSSTSTKKNTKTGDWGQMYYGANHPMKPHRIVMAHHLVLGYGLHKAGLDVFTPRRAAGAEIAQFHSSDYVDFLSKVTPESANRQSAQAALARFNLNEDCPPFPGLWDFCASYAAASIQGAVRLNHGLCDVAINWAGGLHHAKKAEASGFCYVNDLVLAILELLKYNAR